MSLIQYSFANLKFHGLAFVIEMTNKFIEIVICKLTLQSMREIGIPLFFNIIEFMSNRVFDSINYGIRIVQKQIIENFVISFVS